MAPAKILEVRITGCLFSDSHFYRLAVDGHDTELCSVSTTAPKFNKVLHVQVADGNSSMELGVFAMIDGSEKQMAMGTIPVTFGSDFVHHDLTLPVARGNTVTGIIKVAYKQIKLNVVYFLRETICNKSVLGISINTALVGDGADSTTEYKDVRIKVRDKEGTVLGNNKFSNEKPEKTAAFFPLEENEVLHNENNLELVITLAGENENAGSSFQVPIAYGTMSVSVPMASNLALLVTVQLLFQTARLAGLVHEVSIAVLKETGANDKISKFKGNDYATLTRNNVLHLQFMNPDGSTDVDYFEEDIVRAVHGAPFERNDLHSLQDGFFVISSEGQNGRSSKKKPLLKKNLILHMGTFGISPQLVADPSTKLRCKCSMVAINTEVLGATDDTLSCNARQNQVMGTGVLEEKEREVSRETGVISVVLEGALTVTSAEQPLLNALSKAGSYLSARVTLSIVPTESSPLFSPTGELVPLDACPDFGESCLRILMQKSENKESFLRAVRSTLGPVVGDSATEELIASDLVDIFSTLFVEDASSMGETLNTILRNVNPASNDSLLTVLHSIKAWSFELALKEALFVDQRPLRRSRLMIVGEGAAGKTSFFRALTGQERHRKHLSTVGLDTSDFSVQKKAQLGDDSNAVREAGVEVAEYQSGSSSWNPLDKELGEADRTLRGQVLRCVGHLNDVAQSQSSTVKRQTLDQRLQAVHKAADDLELSTATDDQETPDLQMEAVRPKYENRTTVSIVTEDIRRPTVPEVAYSMSGSNRKGYLKMNDEDDDHVKSKGMHNLNYNKNEAEALAFSVWDYGGQRVFQTVQHLFLSRYGVYVLTFDLSKLVADKPKVDNSLTYLRYWLRQIGMIAHGAPLVLLGTHVDKLPGMEKSFNSINDQLLMEFSSEPAWNSLQLNVEQKLCFFPVVNDKADPNISRLRHLIET